MLYTTHLTDTNITLKTSKRKNKQPTTRRTGSARPFYYRRADTIRAYILNRFEVVGEDRIFPYLSLAGGWDPYDASSNACHPEEENPTKDLSDSMIRSFASLRMTRSLFRYPFKNIMKTYIFPLFEWRKRWYT